MQTIWMGLDPRPDCTRVWAIAGPDRALLKTHLAPSPASRVALPSLLEARALGQRVSVLAALVAGDADGSSREPFARDAFDANGAFHSLDPVAALHPSRHSDGLFFEATR